MSDRIRKEHLKNHKERQDLIAMRQKLAIGQMQSDIQNELHRIDGYLQTQTRVVRNDLLTSRQGITSDTVSRLEQSRSLLSRELAGLGSETT